MRSLLFLKYPLPYLDRNGDIKKFEKIAENDILKYYKLFQKRGEIFSPDFPIAIIILPQFGSSPAIAVLKRGELAIEKAIVLAIC